MAKIARKFNTLYQRHHGVWDDAWLNDVGEEPRPQDARNTQRVVEQICRPLDEILARYASGPEDAHVAVLKQCRGLLDQLLREYEADPEHPAA
jgi:hypothetical protein